MPVSRDRESLIPKEGLRPLPKVNDLLFLRESLVPGKRLSLFSSESHLTHVLKRSGHFSELSSQVQGDLRFKSPKQEILYP